MYDLESIFCGYEITKEENASGWIGRILNGSRLHFLEQIYSISVIYRNFLYQLLKKNQKLNK
jgi:hypothetical protein